MHITTIQMETKLQHRPLLIDHTIKKHSSDQYARLMADTGLSKQIFEELMNGR